MQAHKDLGLFNIFNTRGVADEPAVARQLGPEAYADQLHGVEAGNGAHLLSRARRIPL